MRTRHTMTLLLVLTLLTNLAHHERGSVRASEDVERSDFTSKRRILERLIRLGLTSDRQSGLSHSKSQQHMFPASSPQSPNDASNNLYPSGTSFMQWLRSNYIPTGSNWRREEEEPYLETNNSLSGTAEMTNFFFPSALTRPKRLPVFMEQNEFPEVLEDSLLYRRHAEEGDETEEQTDRFTLAKERKRQRKLERQKRREEKKKKRSRNKEKRRRRKENRRFKEVLQYDNVVHEVDDEEYLDCCPSKLVVVEKKVGKDRKNHAVEVRSLPTQEYFYERICLPEIENTGCVFPARSLRKGVVTRCAQQFSLVQAQVRPYNSDDEWHLDYIHVRSGCSCQVGLSSRWQKLN